VLRVYRCAAEGCKGRSFVPDPSSARCIDWQKLRLQELLGADQQQQGKVPRTVEVSGRPAGADFAVPHLMRTTAAGEHGQHAATRLRQPILSVVEGGTG
jgi:hypothetical protein